MVEGLYRYLQQNHSFFQPELKSLLMYVEDKEHLEHVHGDISLSPGVRFLDICGK